jgi:hypothetical protein
MRKLDGEDEAAEPLEEDEDDAAEPLEEDEDEAFEPVDDPFEPDDFDELDD